MIVGTLLDRTVPPRPGPLSSGGDPAVFTFAVSRVFTGDVSSNQRILGEGTPPLPPTSRPEATPTTDPRDLALAEGNLGNDEGNSGSYALFLGAAAVLAGAAVVWRLRRS